MDRAVPPLRTCRGDYGYDASFYAASAQQQATASALVCGGLAAWAAVSLARGKRVTAALLGVADLLVACHVGFYVRTTRVGKFEVWAPVLIELLHGDETLLDLGCGRGAVLVTAAKLLPRGRAVGVDLWRADQTGNSPNVTISNAAVEGVADRVEVHTADVTDLPFGDDSFDVVVSNMVFHNIEGRFGRRKAVREAARVLRPCGRLAIADAWATGQHAWQLRELGFTDVRRRNLGWRMWWGGPWLPTHLITATKPG